MRRRRPAAAAALAAVILLSCPPAQAQQRDPALALVDAVLAHDVRSVERLVADGADPNGRLVDGSTPLMVAAVAGTPALVSALLRAGASADARNVLGMNALAQAAMMGQRENAQALLREAGRGQVAAQDYIGQTPLHMALATGDADLVRLLLDAGASPTTPDAYGATVRAQCGADPSNPACRALRGR